jgi:L-ascorbate metabolism protein UlaG (beta-lactamase superfamily)
MISQRVALLLTCAFILCFSLRAEFAGVDRGGIQYEESGTGVPLILIHGGGLHWGSWDDQFAVLAKKFRTIRYDARLHGQSASEPVAYSLHEDLAHRVNLEKQQEFTDIVLDSLAHIRPLPMEGPILHYLANDGMLMEHNGSRIVIDFPFSGNYDWCVTPAPGQIDALLECRPPFATIDAFLFTHDHVDHFDPELVKKALAAHPEAILAGTTKVIERLRQAACGTIKNNLFVMGEGKNVTWKGLKIESLVAPHARYWDSDKTTGKQVLYDDGYIHCAYRVELAGFSFVHGGDATVIGQPGGASADVLCLDRQVLGKSLEPLREQRARWHAFRVILMHIGPKEVETINKMVASQSDWITALLERDQVVCLSAAAE